MGYSAGLVEFQKTQYIVARGSNGPPRLTFILFNPQTFLLTYQNGKNLKA